MASNGYVRACCFDCLFYRSDREFGDECILYDEMWNANGMKWVSATMCEESSDIEEKHYEKCEHFISKRELRNKAREMFGIKEIKYLEMYL